MWILNYLFLKINKDISRAKLIASHEIPKQCSIVSFFMQKHTFWKVNNLLIVWRMASLHLLKNNMSLILCEWRPQQQERRNLFLLPPRHNVTDIFVFFYFWVNLKTAVTTFQSDLLVWVFIHGWSVLQGYCLQLEI